MQVREVLLTQLHQFHRVFRIVTGDHDGLGGLSARRAQQLKLGRVAVIHLVAIFTHQVNRTDIAFQHRNAHLIRHQQATNHLPEAAKAHHYHLGFIVFYPWRFIFIVRRV